MLPVGRWRGLLHRTLVALTKSFEKEKESRRVCVICIPSSPGEETGKVIYNIIPFTHVFLLSFLPLTQ
jgi:hypothetical protein